MYDKDFKTGLEMYLDDINEHINKALENICYWCKSLQDALRNRYNKRMLISEGYLLYWFDDLERLLKERKDIISKYGKGK
jgi:hypothetical protein